MSTLIAGPWRQVQHKVKSDLPVGARYALLPRKCMPKVGIDNGNDQVPEGRLVDA